jgi:hypothetical protein
LQDPKTVQLLDAFSAHLLFNLLCNVVAKMSTQYRPITATLAGQRRSSGNIEIVTDGVGTDSAQIHRTTRLSPLSRSLEAKEIEVSKRQTKSPLRHIVLVCWSRIASQIDFLHRFFRLN